MTHEEFNKIYKKMLAEEKDIMIKKGLDYTRNSPDKLANFKRIAEKYNIDILKVISIYMEKHFDALVTYITTGRLKGEPVHSKIQDIRNYLALLYAAIIEKERK